jgi:hypothetical protein
MLTKAKANTFEQVGVFLAWEGERRLTIEEGFQKQKEAISAARRASGRGGREERGIINFHLFR